MNAMPHADFAAALLDADRAPPAGLRAWNGSDVTRRFGVYRNNVIVSLVGALADTFPVLRTLVGDEFFDAMAGVYVRARPPTSPVLAHYGAGFAAWLEDFAPARALPYLPDMARLEHARVEAWHAADAPPLGAEQIAARCADLASLPASRPGLHPSCRVLSSAYAVDALWAVHQSPRDQSAVDIDVPCNVLVLRDPADEVLVVPVDPPVAAFCRALLAGASFAQAVEHAPGIDLAGALAVLLRHGAIVAWHPAPHTEQP